MYYWSVWNNSLVTGGWGGKASGGLMHGPLMPYRSPSLEFVSNTYQFICAWALGKFLLFRKVAKNTFGERHDALGSVFFWFCDVSISWARPHWAQFRNGASLEPVPPIPIPIPVPLNPSLYTGLIQRTKVCSWEWWSKCIWIASLISVPVYFNSIAMQWWIMRSLLHSHM